VISSTRVLDPIDRVSEVLFGLIMVLTFTGSLSVADAGRDDVHAMLIGALGCNVAWGIIDAMLYLMGCLAERGKDLIAYTAVRKAATPREAQLVIAGALPQAVTSVLEPADLEMLHRRLMQLPEPPDRARLSKDDWLGAAGVCVIVIVSTFPVVIPFIFMQRLGPAMRVSNAIAVVMLFLTGSAFGRMTGAPSVAGGSGHGRGRVRPRRHDHGAGRIASVAAGLPGDGTRSREHPGVRPGAGGCAHRRCGARAARGGRQGMVLLRDGTNLCHARGPRTLCNRRSQRTGVGCTSRRATTTRRWTRARRVSGYNFSGGETVTWELTPMVGGVFGDTTGVAPGYKGSLSWKKLEFYSEGRVRLRHRQLLGQLPLQLDRADDGAGRVVPVRPDHAADTGVQDRPRHPARPARGFLVRARECDRLRHESDEQKPNFIFAVGVTF
jgi:hypothetical protein